jgi:hypothetical protein
MTTTGAAGRDELATLRPGKVDNPRQLAAPWSGWVNSFRARMRVVDSTSRHFRVRAHPYALASRPHADQMARELPSPEQALRKLLLPYSLALRLRDAGVAPEVVCEYLNVEVDALEGIYHMAETKLRRSTGHGVASAEGKASPGDANCPEAI